MIPTDVVSRLRSIQSDQPAAAQPVVPTDKLGDVLSDLVPGQRVMAEIQALMPNGTYRAMIAQREIVLALPFSAQAGDTLEMEVVENDGKLALAFLANRSPGEQSGKTTDSVPTSLSQTGRLIGGLLAGVDQEGKRPQPTPLKANQPLLSTFPKSADELVPLLKDAVTKSGMFYEAHQARWVEGQFPTEALLQEPQGKLSVAFQALRASAEKHATDANIPQSSHKTTEPATILTTGSVDPGSTQRLSPDNPVSTDLAPLVRQQLDALATQNYVWQGQVWPGQDMHWEIEEHGEHRPGTEENADKQWYTRLKLTLPGLGGIDAVMRLRAGGAIDLSLVTDRDASRQQLLAAGDTLRRQMDEAGLSLTALTVQNGETSS